MKKLANSRSSLEVKASVQNFGLIVKRLKSCHCKIPQGFGTDIKRNILVFWSLKANSKYNSVSF